MRMHEHWTPSVCNRQSLNRLDLIQLWIPRLKHVLLTLFRHILWICAFGHGDDHLQHLGGGPRRHHPAPVAQTDSPSRGSASQAAHCSLGGRMDTIADAHPVHRSDPLDYLPMNARLTVQCITFIITHMPGAHPAQLASTVSSSSLRLLSPPGSSHRRLYPARRSYRAHACRPELELRRSRSRMPDSSLPIVSTLSRPAMALTLERSMPALCRQ